MEINCACATIVSHDGRAITIDGHRRVLLSGSIHYPRSTPEMWPDLIKKGKEGGLDAIETYVFWNAHEPTRRQYDFSGKLDLIRFLKTIQDEGLYGVLRIGPYACAEWNYGGFPVWLHNMPGMVFRTTNKAYMDEMQNFTTMIVDMVKKEKLFASQGGPIILAQIENEYGNIMGPYGEAGKSYIKWCANMAQALDVGVPWIMCQQNDAPQPMYHGGTNFDRTAGGPYITTSYDYDAPLDEYGNLSQPKYGHLKQLHDVLHSMEKTLTYGNISTIDFGNSASATIYTTQEGSSCFFGNGNENSDAAISFRGESYVVPAWSVTILPDCKTEAYNTAKITTQTSMMVKKSNEAEEDPSTLKWSWRPENMDNFLLRGKGESTNTQLFDQKVVSNDQSDYLWYMTTVKFRKRDPFLVKNMSLRVNSTAHVLRVFVNGKHIGSQHAENGKFHYIFEKDAKFKSGRNVISLLSITVGLQNYGAFFESVPVGITGPISIIGRNGDETIVKDLSSHKWSYKTGLNGFENKLFKTESPSKWSFQSVPLNRTMTWYKTTFKAPLGNDPVVVDLLGLGKGTAWINGNNIGRYWPAFISSSDEGLIMRKSVRPIVENLHKDVNCACATIVSHDGRAITIDGHRRVLLSGSIHYPRSTPEMWPDLIKKGKEGGLDAIETYVFWNAHEPTRRQYDFSGKLDLIRFLKTIQDEGLYGVLRIGPYACAEWNYGGFPVWLHNMPGMVFRTTNKAYMDEMQNFTTMIVDMVKKEKLFASQGGPIILAQIENEYGNIMGPYGEAGKSYIKWCANMAQALDVGVPWIMCQQNDAPQPMLNTCNGFYCDNFTPNNPNTPKMWTENWTGWFKQWGGKNPHRTTEDVAFSVARFFQRGGTFNNYYMYHGGTNFDRTAGGPYITTSYDYDAPLDEYGNLNQPKYGHLKQLHDVLHSMEKTLTYGNISTIDFGNSASATIYTTQEGSSCFFGNGNENSDAAISFRGESYVVPAWSVTILPDCKTEAYNTAKITTQTSMMVKKPNEAEEDPSTLKWSWRPENMDNFLLRGKGESTNTQLFDQKVVSNDQSDYLWYMTTVKFRKRDPFLGKNMSLRVNSTAHVLRVFVNGKHIGSQHAENGKFHYIFEKDAKFKSGRNVISLLSITVGLQNYGAFFESVPVGITGPISIIGRNGDETIVKDLSSHKWSYKTGLNGFENKLFKTESPSKWSFQSVPLNRTMTWYKTTFKAPLGNDPVVVDLLGLGKGTAWVNGNNIGRYWPAFISSSDGCSAKCNYRGAYYAEKYHVPRSFLITEGDNTLILFEEMGGNPSLVNFQTTIVGSVCANVYEKNVIELSCDRKTISAIKFASFGNPDGNCGSFVKGTCEGSKNAVDILTKECVGKEKCSIDVTAEKFGVPDCSVNCACATIVSHDGRAITIDGHRRVLLSGSIHYPRSTPEMWPDLIKKGKEGGLDAIETYVFWNAHEPTRRQYDFSGKLDLIRFLKTIQDEGLYGVLRIGPYACAEWNYGGFPVWLHNMPGMVFRTTNKAYMDEMQNFTTMIVDMVKKEKLFASQGGPIILAQIENEYGNIMGPYGEAGKSYIKWCANMAQALDVGVPWIMCQQNDAPQPMLNTCNGFYCDNFTPNNPNTPKMWTENWTGWFKQWGGKNPHRTTEDVAFSVARFFQRGGTFNNYYMYHGGTNFDRTAGGPYITTSYDYDAPLDEYGNLNQPKYGHLKQLHDVLHSMEKTLTYGNISTIDFGNSASATIYTTQEGSSCFFGNGNENSDAAISFRGESYVVPAWSVTILPDCKTEAYNTAKITTQTSMMVKKPNEAEEDPSTLKWSWRPENMDNFLLRGKGESTNTQLFDQKVVSNDQSDYLWYMTTVKFRKRDPFLGKNMSLRVNSTAHVLRVFVNGKHIGSQHAENGKFHYIFEKDAKFKSGRNVISLLSITVGLQNYGAFFESVPVGITGPISIIGRNGDETIVKDLSSHKWSYKTGLNGFENKLFKTESPSKWSFQSVPLNRTMTWYKTTFKAPLGNDPVVVDLLGLGKGTAWVNGNNIGRYWPAFISSSDGCSAKCNYRGAYYAEKYHVPRSFLITEGDNTLILFEEMGGNPSLVNFQTTIVGSVCANVYEKNVIELSCDRKTISAIKFASFGNPDGNCGSFVKGTCEGSKNAVDILTKECVGKEKCSIDVTAEKFGVPDCSGAARRLAIEAIC
ncbi:hypothetical protein HID58_018844 [Brassica napus]|uniref:Beta-galactosidase n=1 Tax=Brassica napus TaxID=3708 RepID=A0ABQ8DCR9_BRANA|nr:hypothetical protein HID58_018844 [Brassica napus]